MQDEGQQPDTSNVSLLSGTTVLSDQHGNKGPVGAATLHISSVADGTAQKPPSRLLALHRSVDEYSIGL